jgi:hypothetical protein
MALLMGEDTLNLKALCQEQGRKHVRERDGGTSETSQG